ncbi:ankyrin repeat-containing domain protein, partial [Dimargaris cristalligena]
NLNELILYARQGDLESYQEATQIVLDRNPEFTDLAHVLTAVNSHGATALHMASANGHIDILKFLLERLPTDGVNQANSEGNTALHWAAMSGKVESVRLLLQHQADPMV